MGANALVCEHPLGLGNPDGVLRVCNGIGGCLHADANDLGESYHACASAYPSVQFTCPASGVVSVMKGVGDTARAKNLAWDAPGGGVAGEVDGTFDVLAAVHPAVTGQAIPNVGLPCAAGEPVSEARDCGWTAAATYLGDPGQAVTLHAPAGATLGALVRVCDGRNACTWSSWRRLAHADPNAADLTFVVGASGSFTVAVSGTTTATRSAPPTPVPTDGAIRRADTYDIGHTPDVASSGDLQNGVLLHIAVPESVPDPGITHPRACDAASNWGSRQVGGDPDRRGTAGTPTWRSSRAATRRISSAITFSSPRTSTPRARSRAARAGI